MCIRDSVYRYSCTLHREVGVCFVAAVGSVLTVIETGFGNFAPFNALVRGIGMFAVKLGASPAVIKGGAKQEGSWVAPANFLSGYTHCLNTCDLYLVLNKRSC